MKNQVPAEVWNPKEFGYYNFFSSDYTSYINGINIAIDRVN